MKIIVEVRGAVGESLSLEKESSCFSSARHWIFGLVQGTFSLEGKDAYFDGRMTWFKVEEIQKVKRKPSSNFPHGFQWKIKLSEIVDSGN